MNDKEKKSTSNDKSITDTVEDLFDDFFAPKKSDESHDSKKREPDTTSPEKVQQKIATDKPLPKKISKDEASDITKKTGSPVVAPQKTIQQKVSPEKPVISRKIISPVQPEIKKPAVKQDAPINYLAAELTRYYTAKTFFSQQSCGELDP